MNRTLSGKVGRTYKQKSLSSLGKFDGAKHLEDPDNTLLQNVFIHRKKENEGTSKPPEDTYTMVFSKGQKLTSEQLGLINGAEKDQYCVAAPRDTQWLFDAGCCLTKDCLINYVNDTRSHILGPKVAKSHAVFYRAKSKNSCMFCCCLLACFSFCFLPFYCHVCCRSRRCIFCCFANSHCFFFAFFIFILFSSSVCFVVAVCLLVSFCFVLFCFVYLHFSLLF